MTTPPNPETPDTTPAAPRYAPPEQNAQPPAAPPQVAPQQQPPAAPQAPAQPQYAQPQYAQPQYTQPQYAQAQYTQPQYAQPLPAPGPGGLFDGALHPNELNRPLYGASMGQAFIRFFKNYANFTGRASRSEFWWVCLWMFIAFFGVGIVFGIIGAIADASWRSSYDYGYSYGYGSSGSEILGGFFGVILIIAFLGIVIPSIAITWRRLHDANMPGPLYFITFVPYVGSLVVLIFMFLSPKPEGRRYDRPNR